MIKSYLTHIISIFLAFFIWLYVQSSAEITATISTDIYYSLPKKSSFVTQPVEKVTYKLSGPRAVVKSIEENPKKIKINIAANYKPQKNEYEYNVQNLELGIPLGVKLVSTQPSLIRIKLDSLITKKVPVELQRIGNTPLDHQLTSLDIEPTSVFVKGAKSVLNEVKKVKTELFDLTKVKQSGERNLKLIFNDKRLSLNQSVVRLTYNVKTTRSNMVVKDIPIQFLSKYRVENSDMRVANLMVLAENMNDLDLKDSKIKVIAELDDQLIEDELGRDEKAFVTTKVKLSADLPSGLHLLKIIPQEIKVRVRELDSK